MSLDSTCARARSHRQFCPRILGFSLTGLASRASLGSCGVQFGLVFRLFP